MSKKLQLTLMLYLAVLASHSFAASKAESDGYQDFLRAIQGRNEKSHLRKLDSDSDSDENDYGCYIGCDSNDDCEDERICYYRKAGDLLPECCDGLAEANNYTIFTPDNFCVSAGCAGNTNDPLNPNPLANVQDDDYFNGGPFPKIQFCQTGCEYGYQCAEGLVCYTPGGTYSDSLPNCCANSTVHSRELGSSSSSSDDESYCVPRNCTPTTAAPTSAPVDFDGLTSGLCFSGETTVTVWGKGTIRMAELQVGDKVLTGRDNYQRVYAFAHRDETQSAGFLQIHTNRSNTASALPLEVTMEHLLYVPGRGPVRADFIQRGDLVVCGGGTLVSQVTKILYIRRTGLYAPLTSNGNIIASDILASNYISPQIRISSTQYVELPPPIGRLPFLTQHDLVHWWLAPLRLVCDTDAASVLTRPFCSEQNKDGKLYYVAWGLHLVEFMEEQSAVAQLLVLIICLLVLALPVATEQIMLLGSRFGFVGSIGRQLALFQFSWS